MANSFGKDILIQAENPQKAAQFYTSVLGFAVTDPNPRMIALGALTLISSLSRARNWGRSWK